MDREQAKKYILMRSKDYLTRDRSGKGWICPICQDGDGLHGSEGITTKDGIHFTCWSTGCFTHSDIIDIIGLERGLTDYSSKLKAAAEAFGITIDEQRISPQEAFSPVGGNQNQPKSERYTQADIHNTADTTEEAEPDYTDFFLQANRDLGKTDYHRAITLETLNRFKVGFVESWRHPKAPKMEASPRLIIPTSKHSYLARYAGAGNFVNYMGKEENKSKVGKAHIFNARAIREAASPIFVVEGEIDAMSIIDVGGEAVGLGSTSNARKFLTELEKQRPAQPLIIALDNEQKPEIQAKVERAVQVLSEGFKRLSIPFTRLDITGKYKDANEALAADREAFRAAIARAVAQVEEEAAAAQEEERNALRQEAVAYSLQSFLKSIEESKRAAFIPTGFPALDSLLDGGLYAGLYIVGAISSLGKTSFCLQIADQIAAAGRDVLIFSLEMARNELIAKSISRLTFIRDLSESWSSSHAKTTRGILTGTRYASYSQTERDLIQNAVADYAGFAKNIYIVEGVGDVGVAQIRERVEKHIRLTGKAPVVLVDYLQIISPADVRATDKQNTDKAVLELKRMSRDHNIPIIGISSFNRDNYTAPVNMASFKESGAVEYSSDVLIGLQYAGMDYQEGEADKAREKRIREMMKQVNKDGSEGKAQRIQLKILKSRNGSKGDVLLDFYPMFNYFSPVAAGNGESGTWKRVDAGSSSRQRKTRRETEPGASPTFEEVTDADPDEVPFK